jgi:hypothetical protein
MQYPIGLREIINDESASDRKVSGVFVFGAVDRLAARA